MYIVHCKIPVIAKTAVEAKKKIKSKLGTTIKGGRKYFIEAFK
jgi:hypothetical protein